MEIQRNEYGIAILKLIKEIFGLTNIDIQGRS